jgi:hypothetical protein
MPQNTKNIYPKLFFICFLKKEKRKVIVWRIYGRFLTESNTKAPTIAIAAIIATAVPMNYISVGGKTVTG